MRENMVQCCFEILWRIWTYTKWTLFLYFNLTLFFLPFYGCEMTSAFNMSLSVFPNNLNKVQSKINPRLEEMAPSDQDISKNTREISNSVENSSLSNWRVTSFNDDKKILKSLHSDMAQFDNIKTVFGKQKSYDKNKKLQVPLSIQNRHGNDKSIMCNFTVDPKNGDGSCESGDVNDVSESFEELYNNIDVRTDTNVTAAGYTDLDMTTVASIRRTSFRKKKLYIGGLFDLSGSRGETLGRSELTAATLAIDHINNKDILPGYELKLITNDTGCDPGVGMDALYDLIYRGEQMLMVTGSACSEVTKTLAEIVPYWNLILVSFASTSPALSAREKYKAFFRLAPADSSQNAPRALFITNFGWNVVATLYEIEEDYSLAIDEMGNTFEQNNITIEISRSFRRLDDIHDNLLAIKNRDVRIIIGSFSEKAARHVLCAAYKLDMYGRRYVWMLINDYVEKWWELSNDTTCSPEQLGHVTDGYFTIDSLSSLSDDEHSYANISMREFLHDYDNKKGPRPLSPYATTTYDSMWAIALTLKGSLEHWQNGSDIRSRDDLLRSFTYEGGASIRNIFFDVMQNLGFLGISGPISFEGPDRKGISVISQNQDGYMIRIALFEPDKKKLNFNCRSCRPIVWKMNYFPRDKYITVTRQKTIEDVYYICVSGVSAGGLVFAMAFLGFNLYHRRLRYIKLSSPKLNNVAVIGCMLVYTGIITLGFNDAELNRRYFPVVCTMRAFLFAAGFSLSFGAMFTKTYRVHQIFTRASGALIKSKLLRDKQLLSIIGALLMVDTVILVLWIVIDPMQKKITNLNVEASDNDEDLLIISQLTTCHSIHMEKWTGALYAYKGLLLVFGVYMAWETRHVKIPALNDSQYIGMNVYNVVMMSVLVVTLSNILSSQPTLAYVLVSSLMLVSTTTTLCLLFVPKIYAIATTKGDPIIAASGIMVDTNCRRFAVDEKRELFFRAEVQNRVYRREIVELDQEIHRLESLLELPVEPYPRLTREQLCRLPESRVDPTPPSVRRERQDAERKSSVSDDSEVCVGITKDDNSEMYGKFVLKIQHPTPKFNRRRPNRMSIRDATNYAVSKLCRFRPRFSIGSINFRHEYEGMKSSSPDDNQDTTTTDLFGNRTRVSHPLLRQQAVEERRISPLSAIKHTSERSETQTFETQLSDNDVDNNLDELTIPSTHSSPNFNLTLEKDYLAPPSTNSGSESGRSYSFSRSFRRKRRTGCVSRPNTPTEHCKISSVEMLNTDGNDSPRFRRARSILEHERRTRIRKLQSDLKKIQQELEDLDELEYEVSVV